MRRAVLVSLVPMSLAFVSLPVAGQPSAEGAREAEAMAALERMGSSLRELQRFVVVGDVTIEDVLTTGQKIQYGGSVEMKVRRPDGMFVQSVSDAQERTIVYDGKTLTLYAPRLGYYASFDAPPTIAETIERASEAYGLEVPLNDLFAWGTDPEAIAKVDAAFVVGPSTVSGIQCTHYAVRQDLVDWQIWIRDGAQALPCKLIITSTEDPAMPQYTVAYHWLPQQAIAENTFAFAPREGDVKIDFRSAELAGATTGE